MNERARKPGLFVVFALFALVSQAIAADSKKITLGQSSIGMSATGTWMAKEIGAFEKYGIQADLIYIATGPVVMQALIGGDLQAGTGATISMVNGALGGAPIVAVASLSNRPYHYLFVQPEINRVEDLRGKTLGVNRFGAATDNLARILLQKHGLIGAVKIRQLGGSIEVGAAFQQRTIDATVSQDVRVSEHVHPKILVRFADLGIPYSMNVIAVSRDYYRRHPQTVEGILRAYVEGVAALHHDEQKALRVIAKYSRLKDPKKVRDQYEFALNFLERVPRIEPEAVNTIVEFTGQKGVTLETFVDNSIVDKLVREGFIDRVYKKR